MGKGAAPLGLVLWLTVASCVPLKKNGGPGGPATVGSDVTIDSGPVHGVLDGDLAIFRGIPYAAAMRWAPPVRPAPWAQPLDATGFGPACPQVTKETWPQSEDCLSLNVWAHAAGGSRPTLVYIHGGAYLFGSSRDPQYDVTVLARQSDAVVVSINYRLGVLGFLALPQLTASDGGTGNWGLRDQIAALDWVQRNIASFGGDPTRVTVFGESAGGVSVCTLLAAPAAQGLYRAAIIQSAPCRAVLALTTKTGTFPAAEAVGAEVATELGCTSGDVAGCLRSQPVSALLNASTGTFNDYGFPLGPTLPVVDGVVLDQRPLAALANGRGAVPLIVGANHDDGSLFVAPLGLTNAAGQFDSYLTAIGQSVNKAAIESLYPIASFGELGAAVAYVTDVTFACTVDQVMRARSAGAAPTYRYELEHAVPNGPAASLGATHGFDYVNLFATFSAWGVTPGAADYATSLFFQTTWSKFARGEAPWNTAGWEGIDATSQLSTAPWRGDRCAKLEALGVVYN
jgi:para-nitrobenzyl esterase